LSIIRCGSGNGCHGRAGLDGGRGHVVHRVGHHRSSGAQLIRGDAAGDHVADRVVRERTSAEAIAASMVSIRRNIAASLSATHRAIAVLPTPGSPQNHQLAHRRPRVHQASVTHTPSQLSAEPVGIPSGTLLAWVTGMPFT
jgi:hypothetical protein